MKITVTVSHDFESVQAAIAFASKLEPLTKELEATAPSLVAAAPAEAADTPKASPIDRENAETLNPSLADQLPEVQPLKRHRRTKAEVEAARAAEAAATPPSPAAAPVPEPVSAEIDPFDIEIDAAKPAPAEMSEDALKIVFQRFVKVDGWRDVLAGVFKALKIEKMRDVPADKRAEVAAKMEAHMAAKAAA